MGALGVAVTPLPTSEVYSALDKGVIDLADRGDLTANLEAGLGEVAKYIIMPGPPQPTPATSRSEERRVGTEWGSTCNSRWWATPIKKHYSKLRHHTTHMRSLDTRNM